MIRRTYKKLIAMLVLFTLAAAPLAGCAAEPSVSFKEKNIEINTYEEYQLEVDIKGGNADDIIWFSENPKVAMVSGGKLIGLKTGETVVTATLGNSVTQCWVTVMKNPVSRTLLVDKDSLTLEVGAGATVTATIRESGKAITNPVEWTTSDSAVATVDQNGRITGVSRGKAIITAYSYLKGQHLFKDISVNVIYLASTNALLRFEDGDAAQAAGATLTEYSGDKEALGFEEGETVYEYKARGGDDSRLFAAEVKGQDGAMNYDRLIFRIKFGLSINGGINLWLARRNPVTANAELLTSATTLLFYDEEGKIATSFDADTVYTAVINLARAGKGVENEGVTLYKYGFGFTGDNDVYISGAVACSEDYYMANYRLEQPAELPPLWFTYSENNKELKKVENVYGYDEAWETSSSGTPGIWDESVWLSRVIVAGKNINQANYRIYDWFIFDVVFESSDFREIRLWNGGNGGHITKEGDWNGYTADNLIITNLSDGSPVTSGTPIQEGVKYRFKVKIMKENLENQAYGLSVNSASTFKLIFANPSFE